MKGRYVAGKSLDEATRKSIVDLLRRMLARTEDKEEEAEIRRALRNLGEHES